MGNRAGCGLRNVNGSVVVQGAIVTLRLRIIRKTLVFDARKMRMKIADMNPPNNSHDKKWTSK